MQLNARLLVDVLIVAIIVEVIALQTIQMLKKVLKTSKWIPILALFVNLFIGIAITLQFTDQTWRLGLFVGFFAWIGADALYHALEKGIKLSGFTEMKTEESDIDQPTGTE